jgi:hypothetical protein
MVPPSQAQHGVPTRHEDGQHGTTAEERNKAIGGHLVPAVPDVHHREGWAIVHLGSKNEKMVM